MSIEAMKRVAEKLRRAGASLPAPELTGTIEGSVVTGLCIALALVEAEIEALAQPEQELVGSVVRWVDGSLVHGWFGEPPPEGTLLYAHPPQRTWIGLTDEEILSDDTMRYYYGMNGGAGPVSQKGKKVVAAIEAKLKEKNI